jgi:hypothetical protein
MEAKNFRIGNLVQDFYKQEPYVIDADGIKLCYLIEKEGRYQTTMHSGIPLTEKWITKLGFESNMFNWQFGDWRISKIEDRFNVGYKSVILVRDMNYVHELQNLFFAITGTELELKRNYLDLSIKNSCLIK